MRLFRPLLLLAFAVGVVPMGALPGLAADAPESVTVWESGGLAPSTIEAVKVAAAMEHSEVTIRRSGSLRLMGVTRGGDDIQRPAAGFGYPMASMAVEIDDGALDTAVLSVVATGRVVMSERSADLRGAAVGDLLEIEGWNGDVFELEIGAVVADPVMDWYEIVMSDLTADRLEFDRASVAVLTGGRLGSISSTLKWFAPTAPVRVGGSSDPITFSDPTLATVELKERFGEFSFRPTGVGDAIEIDAAWVDENIVEVDIEGLGPFRCNRAAVPYLRGAISQIRGAGLLDTIDYNDFQLAGGCFNSRMMRGGDKGFALSRHAWGIAIDLNPSTNPYGEPPTLDPAVGNMMRNWGFSWGATWTVPDGMHFEWVAAPQVFETCAPFRLISSFTTSVAWTVEASSDVCTGG